MTTINWKRIQDGVERDNSRMIWKPYGAPQILDLEHSSLHDAAISVPWRIPEKLAISVAITGAFFKHDQNPNQPLTTDAIRQSSLSVLEAGASTVHIHVRDDDGYNTLSLERFEAVIKPLKQAYPDLAVDGCLVPALEGEWDEMRRVLNAGLLDAAPVNATVTYIGDSLFAKPAPLLMEKTRLIVESGAVPEIAVYTDADISNADRFLIRSGLIQTPAVWLILPALPGCSPMENPRQMVEGLTRMVSAIRDIDPEGMIMVCAAGRASMYVATLAALMGLHIRVGMEDTYWLWPHRDDRVESNLQAYQLATHISAVTGRDIASPAEYRKMIGA
ncbi:3-keto-5-aminohexanoate cleavage protein [Pusillimonas sp. TS35]|uniref:3-keto-5-aminohexanoate cleavage protein n=1 Tax=Paracandidimonas lactea TaxID=2895524 RepID=UPI0013692856|nr:3-keto-5-aminohexanoate cleavage protein [Paracandidimonas lactea]MYN12418.1 3-keto-5-aminohexanoate cleavage protein [Pusillimonas sp. TS35]